MNNPHALDYRQILAKSAMREQKLKEKIVKNKFGLTAEEKRHRAEAFREARVRAALSR
jgi:hypothetical protein